MGKPKYEILVFVDQITTRLTYVLDFLCEGQGVHFLLTNDLLFFEKSDLPKWVYSDRYFEKNHLQFSPADILFEDSIRPIKYNWQEEILLIDDKPDLLAAIFLVLTNYSDYLIGDEYKDKHGRVPVKYNLLFQASLHQKLMVERWTVLFLTEIKEELNLSFTIVKQPFIFTPTFDIDIAYAYKEKERWRNILSKGKDYLFLDFKRIKERTAVENEELKDPYDTFAFMAALANYGIESKVFWLLGDYGHNDKNVDFENANQRTLIKSMRSNLEVGIHPSYKSNNVLGQLEKEINRLTEILDEKIRISRQHYLMVELPKTYNWLIKEGIRHDYTLGFAQTHGFKVGTVRPHRWYNLLKDEITELVLHPFAYMDGSMLEYQNLSPNESKEQIKQLFDEVNHYGGEFSFIWHNSTLGDYGKWKGWKSVFDYTIDLYINNQENA